MIDARALYPPKLLEAPRALAHDRPLVLSAPFGIPLGDLALALLDDPDRVLVLDPLGAGSLAALAVDTAGALVRTLADVRIDDAGAPPDLGAETRRRLAETLGSHAIRALEVASGRTASATFDELLQMTPSDCPIVVQDAERLCARWAGRSLWALRAKAQDRDAPPIVLLTSPANAPALLKPESAFFGFAAHHSLVPPDAEWYLELLDEHPADAVRSLVRRTRGLPTLIAQALTEGDGDLERGWTAVVASARTRLPLALDQAAAIHPLGPRLLRAVARGRPPYGAVPDATSKAIAGALSSLRQHGLLQQPASRRWQLADPALEQVLATASHGPERRRAGDARSRAQLALRGV